MGCVPCCIHRRHIHDDICPFDSSYVANPEVAAVLLCECYSLCGYTRHTKIVRCIHGHGYRQPRSRFIRAQLNTDDYRVFRVRRCVIGGCVVIGCVPCCIHRSHIHDDICPFYRSYVANPEVAAVLLRECYSLSGYTRHTNVVSCIYRHGYRQPRSRFICAQLY